MSVAAYPLEYEYEQVQETAEPDQRSHMWLYFFIFVLLGFQFALIFPSLGPFRVLVRIGAYAGSLSLLFVLKGSGPRPSAAKWGLLAIVVILLSILNPNTNNLLSAFATLMIYIATLGPLFWVSRIRVDLATFKRVIVIFWLFHTVSSFFGVLQVYHPGQYMPNIGTVSMNGGSEKFATDYKNALSITLADGSRVFRPMGLTDSPGGAGISGMYTTLLGIALLVQARNKAFMGFIIGAICLGLFCLYICQIRTLFVMAAVAVAVFLVLYARIGQVRSAMIVGTVITILVLVSFTWAVAVGGDAVSGRLGSLFTKSPMDVYNSNRGVSLQLFLFDDLPTYPLGAGLGRWGMMYGYFADQTKGDSLWAEIQWEAWAYDGGLLLVIFYFGAITAVLKDAYKIARSSLSKTFGGWGSLLLAYNVAGLAMSFDFPFFATQSGMEFWFINASLFAAYQYELAQSTGSLPQLAHNAMEQPSYGYPAELAQ